MKIIGIDLAGSTTRPTGFCLVDGNKVFVEILYSDRDIVEKVIKIRPELVAIDAPLSLLPGRGWLEDKNGVHFRPCDLELRKRGLKFFPITLGPMRMLTERGIRLKRQLEKEGIRVVEIYPGGAQDIWKLPRARRDREKLQNGLMFMLRNEFKLNLASNREPGEKFSPDELDALTAALVGFLYIKGEAEIYGTEPWVIIMPSGPSQF